MKSAFIFLGAALSCTTPVFAQEAGFFAGIDGGAAFRSGSSGTTNGGAAYAGGATLTDVKFDDTYLVGGHVGYRFNPRLAAFVSYEHIAGDVSWTADFANPTSSSTFLSGEAVSDVIMANVAYRYALADATALNFGAGVGISINKLKGVTEFVRGSSYAEVAGDTKTGLAARAMIGVEHQLSNAVSFGANIALAYFDGFTTGDERFIPAAAIIPGLSPTEAIGPYEIDDVWGGTVSAFIKVQF
jgi:hypothetical protein